MNTVAQMTLDEAFAAISAMPTPEETAREIAEIRAMMTEDARRAVWRDASLLYGILDMGYGAMQGKLIVDHVVSMLGNHLYWTVKTPDSTKTIYSRLELWMHLADCKAEMFGKCVELAPSDEKTVSMALETDDLVKDIDPDKTDDLNLDEEIAG